MAAKFVIAACGRSGTMGMADLLNAAGIRASFEDFFRPVMMARDVADFPKWLEENQLSGEVSGLSPPYLKWLPDEIVIFHQTRNPVAVIASLMGLGNLHPRSHWLPNIRFNFRHLPAMGRDHSPVLLCMRYWLEWNALIEAHAKWQYRVEDIAWNDGVPNYGTFGTLLGRLGVDVGKREANALGSHHLNINSRSRDSSITWRSLPEGGLKSRIYDKAVQYGYTQADLERYCPLGSACPHCGSKA